MFVSIVSMSMLFGSHTLVRVRTITQYQQTGVSPPCSHLLWQHFAAAFTTHEQTTSASLDTVPAASVAETAADSATYESRPSISSCDGNVIGCSEPSAMRIYSGLCIRWPERTRLIVHGVPIGAGSTLSARHLHGQTSRQHCKPPRERL